MTNDKIPSVTIPANQRDVLTPAMPITSKV